MRRPLAPSTSLTAVSAATTPSSPGLNSATSKLSVGGAEFRPEQRRPLITNRRARRLGCMTWRARGWIQLVAATALLAAGCGSGSGPAAGAVTSSSPTTIASAPPASSVSLALVTLRGGGHIVVRDITDIGHPTTVATLGISPPQAQFISATELSYLDPTFIGDFATNPSNLIRAPLAGSPGTLVVKAGHGIVLYAWAPDGKTAAYVTTTNDKSELHLVTGENDRLVGSMASILGGCETPSCAYLTEFRLL